MCVCVGDDVFSPNHPLVEDEAEDVAADVELAVRRLDEGGTRQPRLRPTYGRSLCHSSSLSPSLLLLSSPYPTLSLPPPLSNSQ